MTISAELAAVLLDTLGLAGTIEWHMGRYQKSTGVLCELSVSGSAACDLPEGHAVTIFDIYNEALGNVARHARASRVAIGLALTPHEITMVVSDNGIGLGSEALAAKARGIAAIRERARAHAGYCEFAGVRNAGTTVTVSLPLAAAAGASAA
jgi:two-component system, NarL family, sensor histidine kinase UhpB